MTQPIKGEMVKSKELKEKAALIWEDRLYEDKEKGFWIIGCDMIHSKLYSDWKLGIDGEYHHPDEELDERVSSRDRDLVKFCITNPNKSVILFYCKPVWASISDEIDLYEILLNIYKS
jgi:hypothetical protein